MKHLPAPPPASSSPSRWRSPPARRRPTAPRRPPPAGGTDRRRQTAPSVADHAEAGIAWRKASSDADVDAAFAVARAETKPVFLYWGAKWCPPCNQVKATLFNRQDFIERSRAFVPVYVDGDSPGAQKLGTRFRVSGYPTMLMLFKPQRRGGDAPARRGRPGPLHRAAQPRHERRPAGQGGAGRRARRRQGPEGQRLAPARLLFVGHRPDPGARQGRGRRRPWPSSPPPARPTSPRRRCACACKALGRARTRRRRLRRPGAASGRSRSRSPTRRRRATCADLLVNYADRHRPRLAAPGTPERGRDAGDLRHRAAAPRSRHDAVARRPDAGADRPGRPGADRPVREDARQAGPGAQDAGGAARRRARGGGARRPRDHRRLRAPGGHHLGAPTCSSRPASAPNPTPCSRPTLRRATRPTT